MSQATTDPTGESTAEDVDRAVRAAHRALTAALAVPPPTRAGWLTAIADALTGAREELVALAQQESHLPLPRLNGELTRTAFQLKLLAEQITAGTVYEAIIDHADPDWGMGPRPDIRRMRVPLGVVGVFGASNFPFAFSVMGGDSAAALAAGCALVHKIHPAHPKLGARTAELAVAALSEAGAPDGLFATVTGVEAGLALVDHPLVKAIGFTGSTRAGRALADRAAARPEPIPFYGELGSTNPVFVLPDAWASRAEEIIAGYTGSFTLGAGQFCTKPGVLFVPADPTTGEVRDRFDAAVAKVPPAQMLTPALAAGFAAAYADVARKVDPDATPAPVEGDSPAPALLYTTAEKVLADPSLLGEEMFGPASLVVGYESPEQLAAITDQLEGQLTISIHGTDADRVDPAWLAELGNKAGRVLWNDWPTGVTVSYAQQHGGPYPATTASTTTSVGTAAISRFTRPVAYQSFPADRLPEPLRDDNPWGIDQTVHGAAGREG